MRGARAEAPRRASGDLRLNPLEELWGIPIGEDAHTPALTWRSRPGPREMLEAAVLRALQRPPCLVSFSGGVDSSMVLAIATHVAQREGLAPPIPMTNRFPAVPSTEESEWQECVVSHLALGDWVRREWHDELDVIGPVAQSVLLRHGLLFPFNSFFHYPMLEQATGGSLLTGIGGDELFTRVSRRLAASLLCERRRPGWHELPRLAFELAPRPIRARVDAGRDHLVEQLSWIRPPQRRRLALARAEWEHRNPLREDSSLLGWWWRSRMLQCGLASMRTLAVDFDVQVIHPLADPGVLLAVAAAGGATGLGGGSRRRAVERLIPGLLPEQSFRRHEKTTFDGVFWNAHARDFAAGWDGTGVDVEHVDIAALAREWAKKAPLPHSFIQLQRAWLASAALCGEIRNIDSFRAGC